MHHGRLLSGAALTGALILPACASFDELGASSDAGGRDVRSDVGSRADAAHPFDAEGDARAADATGKDGSGADALGAPPTGDFECTKPWNSAPGAGDPSCVGVRTVTLLESPAVTTGGISIAVTAGGHLGVAYDYDTDADTACVHLAIFPVPATSAAVVAPHIQSVGATPNDLVGIASALAAGGAADVLHLAYVDEGVEQMTYQEVVGATGLLSAPELVASGIGAGAYVALAVSGSGLIRASYYLPSTSAVRSAARMAGGGFFPSSEIVTGLDPNAPGTGQSSLVFDDADTPNLLYQNCQVDNFSTPVYQTFDGTSWSAGKTLDNADLNGYAGYSPSLAVSGSLKYAAYFFIAAGQSAPATAELHLAQWQLFTDSPELAILDSVIPANDPSGSGELFRFQVAIAVDKFGLVHMAIVRPEEGNQSGIVEYVRQALVGGVTKWLTDVVDGDVFAPSEADLSPDAFVAITVDDAARPHIAYRSGKNGGVYYATRFDR